MTCEDILKELKALGTEQARKTYKRHGVGDDTYGVSYASLGQFKKRIKTDHALALDLWASGVHDARLLATMIADPAAADAGLLEAWAKDLTNYGLTDALAGLAAQTASARKLAEKWGKAKGEWVGRAGWLVLARLAQDRGLPDDYFEPYLEVIEREIHARKNRVRDAMNSALIAIGIRGPQLQEKALAAARRIGKVEVDHGETNCKTPAAAEYILKAVAHRQRSRSAKG